MAAQTKAVKREPRNDGRGARLKPRNGGAPCFLMERQQEKLMPLLRLFFPRPISLGNGDDDCNVGSTAKAALVKGKFGGGVARLKALRPGIQFRRGNLPWQEVTTKKPIDLQVGMRIRFPSATPGAASREYVYTERE